METATQMFADSVDIGRRASVAVASQVQGHRSRDQRSHWLVESGDRGKSEGESQGLRGGK